MAWAWGLFPQTEVGAEALEGPAAKRQRVVRPMEWA